MHEKALPIAGWQIGEVERRDPGTQALLSEEPLRLSGFESRACLKAKRHQGGLGGEVEEFRTVATPARLEAAIR